ncbi:universal stress protein [Actinoallomurus soli]|uniref:universal stress protein n=1 Tax=Actinoallomurus soli TaxID=2952535 RepID=UPI00209210BC|nr:universal stress protein [Actinoallomurus soli]MCO5967787.1 universal stress protein [Actinoallomurus soli]
MREIVVGADGSDQSLRAVEWAAEEAERRALPLRIVHAEAEWMYDTPVDPRLGGVRELLLTGGKELLARAEAVARERAPGVAVSAETAPGQVARVLLERAGDSAMVVLGGHGMGAATGLLLGSSTLQVVTHAKVPTVVVRDLEPAERREIVVGVEGPAVSEPAVGFAFEEAALREARLRAVHVWTYPASSGPGDMRPLVYDPRLVAEEELRLVEASLAAWRDKFPEVEVVFDVEHGRPVRILGGASARADLLVVGTRGRGGFTGLLLGSVSHGLLHHAHCPLAVVPAAR